MAGNSESVKRSERTKKEKYGPDFHSRIGAAGGSKREAWLLWAASKMRDGSMNLKLSLPKRRKK